MTESHRQQILTALQNLIDFTHSLSAKKESATLVKLQKQITTGTLTPKQIEQQTWTARTLITFKLSRIIAKSPPEKIPALHQQLAALKENLSASILPPTPQKIPESHLTGLAGNTEPTLVFGTPADAPIISQHAIAAAQKFSAAIFQKNIKAAYALCASEYTTAHSLARFTADLAKADKKFAGPPLACNIERITSLYADAPSRLTPNRIGNWPAKTPKENKRAILGAFWLTNPSQNRGRWITLWITQENQSYRIAKFTQYLQ